jgi:phospholipase C
VRAFESVSTWRQPTPSPASPARTDPAHLHCRRGCGDRAGGRGLQIAAGPASAARQRLIDRALAASTANATLSDIKHVRGFCDPAVLKQTVGGVTYPVFDQFGFQPGTGVDASGYMQPFHLLNDPPTENGETTNDVAHDWVTQHDSWNGGAMNAFMTAHLASDGDTNDPVTMGYYTSNELAFYYALANAFTICDRYFCSVLGPTDPNRPGGRVRPAERPTRERSRVMSRPAACRRCRGTSTPACSTTPRRCG